MLHRGSAIASKRLKHLCHTSHSHLTSFLRFVSASSCSSSTIRYVDSARVPGKSSPSPRTAPSARWRCVSIVRARATRRVPHAMGQASNRGTSTAVSSRTTIRNGRNREEMACSGRHRARHRLREDAALQDLCGCILDFCLFIFYFFCFL